MAHAIKRATSGHLGVAVPAARPKETDAWVEAYLRRYSRRRQLLWRVRTLRTHEPPIRPPGFVERRAAPTARAESGSPSAEHETKLIGLAILASSMVLYLIAGSAIFLAVHAA